MAFGWSSRMDSRRPSSSSYCSTVIVAVVFFASCLVGAWVMTSSAGGASTEVKSEAMAVMLTASKQLSDISSDSLGGAERGGIGDTDAFAGSVEEILVKKIIEDANDKSSGNGELSDALADSVENTPKNNEDSDDKPSGSGVFSSSNGDDVMKDDGDERPISAENQVGVQDLNTNVGGDVLAIDAQLLPDDNENGTGQVEIKEKVEEIQDKGEYQSSGEKDTSSPDMLPDAAQSELLKEVNTQNGAWSTQAAESRNEKELQASLEGQFSSYNWKLCNSTAGADYIPCLDNMDVIKKLQSTKHYEHRERHCPGEAPTCLVPLPDGYKQTIEWPKSRDKIWYSNVPHSKLAEVKGHQNWVKVSGEYLTFPGGGTQFKHGALHYIDFIQQKFPDIAWGKRSRVVLDVGCGVASFGGYLFERDVLTMSFAPKDEHEAQVQFALERGIPAISAVMGTKRLPFPGIVFDVIHCARCRVPWHIEGGKLLLELNRLLRPGGYFVWSATPVYQDLKEDVEIWKAMSALTKSICWKMVSKTKDPLNQVGLAIYKKPSNNECYENRTKNLPPLCQESDDPNAAWNVPLQACMLKVPIDSSARGSRWPEQWPSRSDKVPYWIASSRVGVYGKAAPDDFQSDYDHWKRVVSSSYLKGMGINWAEVRNVMDMRAIYGGFAAALRNMRVWVMNVVSIDAPDTLTIIYERGFIGMYHDWCESFSTYPRTYDLLHADHLFSEIKKSCQLEAVMAEVDRVLRPKGKLIVRDDVETIGQIEGMAKSMQWEVRLAYSKDREGLLCVEKSSWRPDMAEASA